MNKYTETVLISNMNGQQKRVQAIWKGDRFSVTQSSISESFVITHNETGMALDPGFSRIDYPIEFMIRVAKKMDLSKILSEIPAIKDKYELANLQESHPEKIDRWLVEVREIYLGIKSEDQ